MRFCTPPSRPLRHAPTGTRRRARSGFIILFGSKNVVKADGTSVQAPCPRCGQAVPFLGKSFRTWFTLFFIPIFPMSGAKRFTECSNCHAQFRMSPDELSRQLNASQQQQMQQAIQMYNSLRASPANSVTLDNLMRLYASLKEFDQAVSAAREFPQALNASEQCMTTLGRVLLEQNRHADAVRWFDSAMTRNPMYGDAAYYKAVALMSQAPPDMTGAVAAARSARSAGHPNAEALLREVEGRARVA